VLGNMKFSVVWGLSLIAFAAAANHKLPRAIGDYCDAPEVYIFIYVIY
jgi:hypothetical protein